MSIAQLLDAAENGDIDRVVRLIDEEGIDVNGQDEYMEWTPLILACNYGHLDVVELLLAKGADLYKSNYKRATPFHRACRGQHAHVVEYLLSIGVDFNRPDYQESPPIIYASSPHNDNTEVVALLVAAGADVMARNQFGRFPLLYVSSRGHPDSITVLLDANADINGTDNWGWTPLHEACRWNRVGCVQVLLDRGADVTMLTWDNGDTALELARRHGHESVIEEFRQRGSLLQTAEAAQVSDAAQERRAQIQRARDEASASATTGVNTSERAQLD
ncbi:hypothetical protein CAOG_06686 [Capsaspora owczarzaki ATCC 30864]|uniref:Peptidase A2 domain-containing protein n=1 Tax=Capsaspora owczarzaki (strain ATCC 30864) TaxID=595528 RepID=A0A0D2UMT1_CAPO3|nr:hypothetical protein CAOG_06686 [Capsaspora owczarzaki ATCC 30864]KJE96346.1 hypothetical protein CAOG_006686 [Capsaspora owczarzaki ATCC 30864]|eukprot:XP_004344307.1 hypothetical protein CAOG_06686 [Capsaspora owczarzaki ATCC 30864]